MEIMFVDVKTKFEIDYEKVCSEINKIPEDNIAICYSNQFEEIAKKIKDKLGKRIIYFCQVLGCSNPVFPPKTNAILIVGQGKFHSVSLAYESKIPTYLLENNSLTKIKEEEILKMENQKRGALLKYLSSKRIGIIVSTKPGQNRIKKAIDFKKSLRKKKGYLFITNNICLDEFENFDLDFWVNTACPRMDLTNGPLVNLDKIPKEFINTS